MMTIHEAGKDRQLVGATPSKMTAGPRRESKTGWSRPDLVGATGPVLRTEVEESGITAAERTLAFRWSAEEVGGPVACVRGEQ